MPVITEVEPTRKDIDDVVRSLEESWTAAITVRLQSTGDVGYREIMLSFDAEAIGMLRYGQTLTVETAPRAPRLQAFLVGFLGADPLYLTFEREDAPAHGS